MSQKTKLFKTISGNKLWLSVAFFTIFTLTGFNTAIPNDEESDFHMVWDDLLKKHVNSEGGVNYKGFIQDKNDLNRYLNKLSNNEPGANETDEVKLAYWINAYNAYTVKLIIDNYPVESIKELGAKLQIPFINSPWDIRFITIGEKDYTLNDIEHKILRKKFNEPRIHFAIVCASISCPVLKNEAYTSTKLEGQLEAQAIRFINDPTKNKITSESVEISKIFSWFKGDFTKDGTLIEYLNKYSDTSINLKAKVNHLKYDWGLNEDSSQVLN